MYNEDYERQTSERDQENKQTQKLDYNKRKSKNTSKKIRTIKRNIENIK